MKRTYGPYTVETSNEDKSLFPDGTTKKALIDYYDRIGDVLLPHVRNRPLVLYRCPDGIDDGFYQKQVADHFPEWIGRVTVSRKEGGHQTLATAGHRAALVWLANQAVVELHAWSSTSEGLDSPDRLILDLDPPDDDARSFSAVRRAALRCRDILEKIEIRPWVKTSGSSGLHVVVALDGRSGFDAVRELARRVADRLVRAHPSCLTTEIRKDRRGGRVYLDVLRNAYAQTAVAPYSLRARAGAPVAAPLEWDEVERDDLGPRTWTLRNIFRRLGQRDDPWSGIGRSAVSVETATARLERLPGEPG